VILVVTLFFGLALAEIDPDWDPKVPPKSCRPDIMHRGIHMLYNIICGGNAKVNLQAETSKVNMKVMQEDLKNNPEAIMDGSYMLLVNNTGIEEVKVMDLSAPMFKVIEFNNCTNLKRFSSQAISGAMRLEDFSIVGNKSKFNLIFKRIHEL
jgi:hypothetical protein